MRLLRSTLVTAPAIAVSTVAFGAVSLALSLFDASGHRQVRVARAWAKFLCWVAGVKVVVTGIEKIRPGGSYVFASNHLSYMDTPVVLSTIPVQFRFLAKEGLFKIPFLGTHLRTAGHIPVPREDPRAAIRTLQLAGDTIREKGISLLVFPEGGRSEDGELHEFKEGAAYIALKAQAPLVPLALKGTRQVLPMHGKVFSAGTVRLCIGDPIPTAGLALNARASLTRQSREQVAAMLEIKSETVHS